MGGGDMRNESFAVHSYYENDVVSRMSIDCFAGNPTPMSYRKPATVQPKTLLLKQQREEMHELYMESMRVRA